MVLVAGRSLSRSNVLKVLGDSCKELSEAGGRQGLVQSALSNRCFMMPLDDLGSFSSTPHKVKLSVSELLVGALPP